MWAELYQMKALDSLPTRCPGYYFSIEYKRDREFSQPCETAGIADSGSPIYRSKPEAHISPSVERYSARLGDTLIVLRVNPDIDNSQAQDLLPIFDTMRPLEVDPLVAQAD